MRILVAPSAGSYTDSHIQVPSFVKLRHVTSAIEESLKNTNTAKKYKYCKNKDILISNSK